ncbi:MAG: hydrolase, partial [Anaerolineae bacterium]|nr:hydrolase [Anaerolineae bacterium]
MLNIDNTILLVVDVQGRLAQVVDQPAQVQANVERMIRGAQVLGLPILWTEQVPEKLGPTVPELAELLVESSPSISKSSFSCCGAEPFMAALTAAGRGQVLLTGMETHVCVYQTALDLLNLDYEVHLVTDAVSSRTPENKTLGIERMQAAGATLTSTEMALFELLRVAE